MGKYILKKFIYMLGTLWIIVTVTFFILRVIPGNPFQTEENLSPETVKMLEDKYLLNEPLIIQYKDYLANILHFDLGYSYKELNLKVSEIILKKAKYSAIIGTISVIISLAVGILFGVIAAKKNKTFISRAIGLCANIGIAIPNFIIAAVVFYLFCERLYIVHIFDMESSPVYLIPAIILSIYPASFIIRLVKTGMLNLMNQKYVRVFKAYGISEEKIFFKYILRDAILPVITYISKLVTSNLMGFLVIEKMFNIPGLGKAFVDSVINRDYSVVLGLTLFFTIIYLLIIFITDIIYAVVDPRIDYDC